MQQNTSRPQQNPERAAGASRRGALSSAGTIADAVRATLAIALLSAAAPASAQPALIFADGFESGDTSAWSTSFPPPQPPIANDDADTTFTDTPVDVLVTLNDDGNGWLLDVGDLLIESAPTDGTADPGIGAILYTPDPGFEGVDSFVYSVSNATGLRDSATVTVTVIPPPNAPPVANPDQTRTTPETPITISVLSNDFDVDGSLDPSSVVVTTPPTDGATVVASDGIVTYTPDAGFEGEDLFEYTVADDQGAVSDPAAVTVTVGPFLGEDMPPVDNISTAELEFLVRFGGQFVSRGVGLFLGFNHGTEDTVANAEQIGDYTFLFPNNQSDRAVSEPYTFTTDLQTGSVNWDEAALRYRVEGFVAAPIYAPLGGNFTVSLESTPGLEFSVVAPDNPILATGSTSSARTRRETSPSSSTTRSTTVRSSPSRVVARCRSRRDAASRCPATSWSRGRRTAARTCPPTPSAKADRCAACWRRTATATSRSTTPRTAPSSAS